MTELNDLSRNSTLAISNSGALLNYIRLKYRKDHPYSERSWGRRFQVLALAFRAVMDFYSLSFPV